MSYSMSKKSEGPNPENLHSDLARAIEYGSEQDLRRLLDVGCDVCMPLGPDGWPPLCCTVARGQTKMTALLLRRGADPNQAVARGAGEGMVALDFCRDVGTARRLLAAGASLERRDRHGWTPRQWAAHLQRDRILDLFNGAESSL